MAPGRLGRAAPCAAAERGVAGKRAAPGRGPEFGASLATFLEAREGAAGGVSGEARGEGAGVFGARVTLGNFAPGRGGLGEGSSPLPGRVGMAGRPRGGGGAGAELCCSGDRARASGEAGHPPGGAGEGGPGSP